MLWVLECDFYSLYLEGLESERDGVAADFELLLVFFEQVADIYALRGAVEGVDAVGRLVPCLICADDDIVAVLSLLDGLDDDIVLVGAHERIAVMSRLAADAVERQVERIALVDDIGGVDRARVRVDGVGEAVNFSVLLAVRVDRAAQEARSDVTVLYVVTVLAVVEDGETEAVVAEIDPLVTDDFKLREIPERVAVGRALVVAELDIISGLGGVDINGEVRLEKYLLLFPVDRVVNVDARQVCVEDEALLDGRGEELARDLYDRADGSALCHIDCADIVYLGVLLIEIDLDIPCLVVERSVVVGINFVENFALGRDCSAGRLVNERRDVHVLVELDGEELVLYSLVLDLYGVLAGLAAVNDAESLVSLCGHALCEEHKASVGGFLPRHDIAVGVDYREVLGCGHIGDNDIVALSAEGVENGQGVAVRRADYLAESVGYLSFALGDELVVLLLGILVDLFYRRAGDYIVELVEEYYLPAVVDELTGIGRDAV